MLYLNLIQDVHKIRWTSSISLLEFCSFSSGDTAHSRTLGVQDNWHYGTLEKWILIIIQSKFLELKLNSKCATCERDLYHKSKTLFGPQNDPKIRYADGYMQNSQDTKFSGFCKSRILSKTQVPSFFLPFSMVWSFALIERFVYSAMIVGSLVLNPCW